MRKQHLTWVVAFGLLPITVSAAPLPRSEIHRLVAKGCGIAQEVWGMQLEWNKRDHEAMVKIIWKESSFDPNCTTSLSSSAGLMGFLDSTRRRYGITRKSPLDLQVGAGWAYCYRRYKRPIFALTFHRMKGYY